MTKVRVKDHGAKALVNALKSAGRDIEVGVIGSEASASREGGLTNAQLATIHEYGLGVPQRSFIRGFFIERKKEIDAAAGRIIRKAIEQPKDFDLVKAANVLGSWLVGQIQTRIANGIAPPNAPSTIKRKGSSTPLIDTGVLRSAITYRVK